jgi:hypothetical protein
VDRDEQFTGKKAERKPALCQPCHPK